ASTNSPAITANNLSNPMRWLLPPATMRALSIKLKRRLLFTLQRFNESRKLFLHFCTQRFAIRAATYLRLQCFHHYAHLPFRRGASLGNCLLHDLCQFVCADRLRQITVQNRQLFFFFFCQFGAPALFKTLDRIVALLRLFAN